MAANGNMLAADCIVLCCCCQCLILQIVVFLIVKLPHKLVKRTRRYAKKLAARRRARSKQLTHTVEMAKKYEQDDSFRSLGNSFRIDVKDMFLIESPQLRSINEVENVLTELYSRGDFGFGSFWGNREDEGEVGESVLRRIRSCPDGIIDYDCIGFRLMELFGSSNLSSFH